MHQAVHQDVRVFAHFLAYPILLSFLDVRSSLWPHCLSILSYTLLCLRTRVMLVQKLRFSKQPQYKSSTSVVQCRLQLLSLIYSQLSVVKSVFVLWLISPCFTSRLMEGADCASRPTRALAALRTACGSHTYPEGLCGRMT